MQTCIADTVILPVRHAGHGLLETIHECWNRFWIFLDQTPLRCLNMVKEGGGRACQKIRGAGTDNKQIVQQLQESLNAGPSNLEKICSDAINRKPLLQTSEISRFPLGEDKVMEYLRNFLSNKHGIKTLFSDTSNYRSDLNSPVTFAAPSAVFLAPSTAISRRLRRLVLR